MEQSKRSEYIQIIFLILLLLGIGALVFASIQIIKYREMLSNPLGYNLDKFDLTHCTCYDKDMKSLDIKSNSYNQTFNDSPFQIINLTNYATN